jgi:hypothetical protein
MTEQSLSMGLGSLKILHMKLTFFLELVLPILIPDCKCRSACGGASCFLFVKGVSLTPMKTAVQWIYDDSNLSFHFC